MRQLTQVDAPTGSRRRPDENPSAPLTAPQRPRSPHGRRAVFVVTLLAIGATAALVLVGHGGLPVTAGGSAAPDVAAATRLVASTMPEGDAFEPELGPEIGDAGTRVDMGWSPAGTSLACDVGADPPLSAERHRIAVAAAAYTTNQPTRELTGRAERLDLTAVALAPAGAGVVLDEVAAAVPACAANPISAMRDAQLGTLPNVDGVVFRAHHGDTAGDGPDPAVSCVMVRRDALVLRSCGLSTDGARADGLAVRGLDALQVRLEQAQSNADLPPPAAQVRTPTWERAPVVTVHRNAYVPGCVLLTTDEVAAAAGLPVVSFDRPACRWELAGGWVRLSAGDFGSGLTPAHRSVLRGNSAVFAEPAEGECVYKIATTATAALRVNVNLTEPGPRPCTVARRLLGVAFDRLPPA